MDKLRAMVTGIHGYVPEYRLTNKELESLVDTNDEWIMSRTGIKERRILKGENQGTSVLGIGAVKGLLEKTGTDPLDIELIICATVTPDMPFPATANIIADKVGAKNSFSFDIGAACSGFLYALQLGAQFIQAGTPMFSVVNDSTFWIVANFKESQLQALIPGKKVDVRIEAYPDLTVTGTIASLSEATGAKFALLPPDNSSGNFVKVTQRIPIKIWIDDVQKYHDMLRAGMSVFIVAEKK